MEQRKSYQLYLLEGEQQKVEFEYQNAYRADENIQKRMESYKFYLRMSVIYAIIAVAFISIANAIGFIAGGISMVLLVVPFVLLISLISVVLWLGMIWKSIKFGVSYRKLKERKEQAETDLISASQKLNGIQIKIENLRKEIGLEEEQRRIENPEASKEKERDTLVRRQETLGYRIDRLKKNYEETEADLHIVIKEEFENERDKKRYGRLTIAGIIILIIFVIIQQMDVTIFSTVASKVIILLMPWCIIIPYSIGWLSKAMNTFWGEELWINRFVFRNLHDYSLAGKKQKYRENMKQLKETIAILEKEKEHIAKELQFFH